MKFGEKLEAEMISEWRPHYLDYNGLKKFMKGCTETQFIERLENEQRKVNQFTKGRISELVNSLQYCEREVARIEEDKLEEIGSQICTVDNFVFQNKEGFRKIAKKYAKVTGNSIGWFKRGQADSILHRAGEVVHELIVQLSNCWVLFKAKALANGTAEEEAWNPPASFSRKTIKYWVDPAHMSQLKVFVLKHVPVLEMNQSRKVELGFETQQLTQTHNFISSVYLDSDEFTCYHRRIKLEEGAQLLRVRWYGGEIGDDTIRRTSLTNHEKNLPGVPGGTAGAVPTPGSNDRFLFVERKTHHEKWTGVDSVKERFQLKRKRIGAFMDGSMDVAQELSMMVEQGHLKADQLESSTKLAQESQQLVQQGNLTPKIRTSYHRTAFQEKTNNRVRLSLDFPLYLFKETAPFETTDHVNHFWNKLTSPVGLEPFPYGVLEIKTVGDDQPAWVAELLSKNWLIQVQKFSKFQHSIATNFTEHLELLPYWVKSIGDANSDGSNDEDEVGGGGGDGGDYRTVKVYSLHEKWPEHTEPLSSTGVVQGRLPALPLALPAIQGSRGINETDFPAGARVPELNIPELTTSTAEHTVVAIGGASGVSEAAPLISDMADIRADNPALSHELKDGRTPQRAIRRRRDKSASSRQAWGSKSKVAPSGSDQPKPQRSFSLRKTNLTKTKVEPKTFFANERTFIQWLGAALFLVTLASAMMATGETGKVIGTMFFPVGIFFLIYALATYHWRLKMIKQQDGSRFDDPYGPTILTIGVLISVVAVLIFVWTEETLTDPDPVDVGTWDSGMIANTKCAQLSPYSCNSMGYASAVTYDSAVFSMSWTAGCLATLPQRIRSAEMIVAAIDVSTRTNSSGFHGCMNVGIDDRSLQTDYELPVKELYCVRAASDDASDPCPRTASVVASTGSISVAGSMWAAVAGNFSTTTAMSACGTTSGATTGSSVQYQRSSGVETNARVLISEVTEADTTLELLGSSYPMRYTYDVIVAGSAAKLSLRVEYASATARSTGSNPTNAMIHLDFTSAPTLTSYYHAGEFMRFLALVENEARTEGNC